MHRYILYHITLDTYTYMSYIASKQILSDHSERLNDPIIYRTEALIRSFIIGGIVMIRNQEAYDKAQAKAQRDLENKITAAVENLPRIIAKHGGTIHAGSRAELHTILIRDGVLGGDWVERHIANAVKHNKPLPQHQEQWAGTIIDNALKRVHAAGKIVVPRDSVAAYEFALPAKELPPADPDERYPVSQLLGRQRVQKWELQLAHD